jgi:hypothetical protein
VGGDGSTVTDDTNATTGLDAGGHRTRFVPALAQVVAVAQNAVTSATSAAGYAASALGAPGTNATTTTSITPAAGSISFTLAQTGKLYSLGQTVVVASAAAPTTKYVQGQISAFTSGSGAMTIVVAAGAYLGTAFSDGVVSLSASASSIQIGDIVYSTYTRSAPTYLPCDGSIYLKSSYSALNAVLTDPYVESSTTTGGNLPVVGAATKLIAQGGGVFGVFTSGSTSGATSTNGTSWTTQTLPASTFSDLKFNNTLFMATISGASTSLYTSSDFATWNTRTLPSSKTWIGTAYGNSVYVAVAADGTGATSSDAITWTGRTLPAPSSTYTKVLFGNGVFLAMGASTISTSTDGITWTSRQFPYGLATSVFKIAYGNGYFVLTSTSSSGYNDTAILYSTDGVTWWSAVQGATEANDLIFSNGLFFRLAGGGSYVFASSTPWGWQGPFATSNGLSNFGTTPAIAYNGTVLIVTSQANQLTGVNTIGPSSTYLRTPVAAGQFGARAYVKAQ